MEQALLFIISPPHGDVPRCNICLSVSTNSYIISYTWLHAGLTLSLIPQTEVSNWETRGSAWIISQGKTDGSKQPPKLIQIAVEWWKINENSPIQLQRTPWWTRVTMDRCITGGYETCSTIGKVGVAIILSSVSAVQFLVSGIGFQNCGVWSMVRKCSIMNTRIRGFCPWVRDLKILILKSPDLNPGDWDLGYCISHLDFWTLNFGS